MTMDRKDLGIAQALLQRLETIVLPVALDLKARVDRGDVLSAVDRMVLRELTERQRQIPTLVERQPQFKPLAAQVDALIEDIAVRARANEARRGSNTRRPVPPAHRT